MCRTAKRRIEAEDTLREVLLGDAGSCGSRTTCRKQQVFRLAQEDLRQPAAGQRSRGGRVEHQQRGWITGGSRAAVGEGKECRAALKRQPRSTRSCRGGETDESKSKMPAAKEHKGVKILTLIPCYNLGKMRELLNVLN